MTRNDHSITLSDWRIPPTDVCPTAIGPASGGMTLPLTAGTNQLVIRHRGVDDHYVVSIDRELIRVRPIRPARISTTTDTLIRRIIPGSFALRCSGAAWLCARGYRELSLIPGLRPLVVPEAGRNPFGIRYDAFNLPDREPVHYFIGASSAATTAALAALQRVHDETAGTQPGWEFTVIRWTGARWNAQSTNQESPR
jgi:hypothetical protein